jgi:ribonuclease HI
VSLPLTLDKDRTDVPMTASTNRTAPAARLIKRYRELSEARGLARAHGLSLEPTLADELASLEVEIVSQLASANLPPPTADDAELPAQSPMAESESPHAAVSATVFTDGAAEGNPGPGGYCALVRIPGRPNREISGGAPQTTNNKMELTAAIVGLRTAIDAGATDLTVVSDSEYLIKGMTRWLSAWIANDWQTTEKQPVKNRELWEQLAALARSRSVRWSWVRGHAGHPENERCHVVAAAAARKAARK